MGLSTYKKSRPLPTRYISARRLGASVLLPIGVFLFYGATNTLINYMNLHYIPTTDKTIQVMLTMVLGAVVAGLGMLWVLLVQGKERIQRNSLLGAVVLGVPNFLSFYMSLLALSAFGSNGAFVYPLYKSALSCWLRYWQLYSSGSIFPLPTKWGWYWRCWPLA